MWFHNFKMKYWKEYRDHQRCLCVIASCRNFHHASCASKMVNNYGKMYGLKHPWTILDTQANRQFMFYLDQIDYQERLQYGRETREDN